MKSVLHATSILSASSLGIILVGLVSAKAWATMLGASGIGFMGLLQSLLGLSVMIAGIGIGPGIVRGGASALAKENVLAVAALRRAAWVLFWIPGSAAAITLLVFRNAISRAVLDSPSHGWSVALVGIALLFALANAVQTSLLNAHHRVSALAKIGVINSILGTSIGLLIVWWLREDGIALAVVATSAVGLMVSRFFLWKEIGPVQSRVPWPDVVSSARSLVHFGIPYTGSMLVGTGIQLALPIFVVHLLGQTNVGYFRAATAISVTYLGFLTGAMVQDYYPRLSAVRNDPRELSVLANQQFRLVMLIGAPMILGVLALVPYLVPIIYTSSFTPTVDVLEWQLVGDVFKFGSWSIAYVILASRGSSTYFLIEVVGGMSLLASSWLGMHWMGLSGLGAAFLVSYGTYFVVVYIVLHRQIGFTLDRRNVGLMAAAVSAAITIRLLTSLELDSVRTPIALCIAGAASLYSMRMILRELGGFGALGWQRRGAAI